MVERIKCIDCKYATEDITANEGSWIAYECSNPSSEYFKSLLNVTMNGKKLSQITWQGCCEGKKKEDV